MMYYPVSLSQDWVRWCVEGTLSEVDHLIGSPPCRCGEPYMHWDVYCHWYTCFRCNAVVVSNIRYTDKQHYLAVQSAVRAWQSWQYRRETERLFNQWHATGIMPKKPDDNDFNKG